MAVPKDDELRELLDRFVCVRLVQMWGVDLERFQFDFAMTWAIFYMNADGTIYGRYGTRSAMQQQSARDISLAGFVESLRGALELHERYAQDPRATLREVAGKQTRYPPQWDRPEKIPDLAKNERLAVKFSAFAEGQSQRRHGMGCIHCHMVPNHELVSLWAERAPIPERLVWPYPMPGAVGLDMDPQRRATVSRVRPESAAAAAGVRPGDEIAAFDGQTILSTADIQWVLHNAPSEGRLDLEVRRDGRTKKLRLELEKDWRRRLGDWRFTNMVVCMQVAGFQGRPVRAGGRDLAIRVARVHPKRMTGVDLRPGDVIVAIDGKTEPMNLGMLTQYLLGKKPGSKIAVTRRRDGEGAPRTVRWRVE